MSRYRSADPGDFSQQQESGFVSEAFGATDYPKKEFDSGSRVTMDFQGGGADFGHATLRLPSKPLGAVYKNPFAYPKEAYLPPRTKLGDVGDTVSDSLNSIKWIAFIGFAIFAYYKLKEHKEDLKGLVSSARSAASSARDAALRSNPTAAELYASENEEDEDDEGLAHHFED